MPKLWIVSTGKNMSTYTLTIGPKPVVARGTVKPAGNLTPAKIKRLLNPKRGFSPVGRVSEAKLKTIIKQLREDRADSRF